MKLHCIFIPVHDISSAIIFYTKKLFFKKMNDISKIDNKKNLEYRKVSLLSTQ